MTLQKRRDGQAATAAAAENASPQDAGGMGASPRQRTLLHCKQHGVPVEEEVQHLDPPSDPREMRDRTKASNPDSAIISGSFGIQVEPCVLRSSSPLPCPLLKLP